MYIFERMTYMTSKNVEKKIEGTPNPYSSSDEFVPSLFEFLRCQVDSKNPWHILGKEENIQELPSI